MKRPFSFGIRSFLIGVAVCAGLALVLRETIGRLSLESEAREVIFSTGPSPTFEVFGDSSITELQSSAQAVLSGIARERGFRPSIVELAEVRVGNRRFMKYHFDTWTRKRLKLLPFGYTLDYGDPEAQSRNEKLAEAIEEAERRLSR